MAKTTMVAMKRIDLTIKRRGGIPRSVRAPCERRGALLGVKARLWLFQYSWRSIKKIVVGLFNGG